MESLKRRDLGNNALDYIARSSSEEYIPKKKEFSLVNAVYDMTTRYFSYQEPRIYHEPYMGLAIRFDFYPGGYQVVFNSGLSMDDNIINAGFKNFMDIRRDITFKDLDEVIYMLKSGMHITGYSSSDRRFSVSYNLPKSEYKTKGFAYNNLSFSFFFDGDIDDPVEEWLFTIFKSDLKDLYQSLIDSNFEGFTKEELIRIIESCTLGEIKDMLHNLPFDTIMEMFRKVDNSQRARKKPE